MGGALPVQHESAGLTVGRLSQTRGRKIFRGQPDVHSRRGLELLLGVLGSDRSRSGRAHSSITAQRAGTPVRSPLSSFGRSSIVPHRLSWYRSGKS